MQFNKQLIEKLTAELNRPLPGQEAQYRMAPSYRPRLSKNEIDEQQPRIGGVLVLLYEVNNELHLVFTQRKQYPGVHSGQMSFPGGKQDEGDNDLIHTALREAHEEIGLQPETVQVIGRLSELYIPPSNFLVYPVVGFTEVRQPFVAQQTEVEEIVEIPLSFFMDRDNINPETRIQLFNGTAVKVPAYIYGKYVIWGATAIMLSEFTFIIERVT